MAVRATCPLCGVSLFSPSDAFTADAILDRHQRSGRCEVARRSRQAPPQTPPQVERSALTDDEGALASRAAGAGGVEVRARRPS